MLISKELSRMDGVIRASVMMGTDNNKIFLEETGLLDEIGRNAGRNDILLTILAESEESLKAALKMGEEYLTQRRVRQDGFQEIAVKDLSSALKKMPQANLVLISVPGEYAKAEAMEALRRGLHVLLFSDHVSIKEERELKEFALRKGLLMMGPDCGTAVINGVPLAFANRVSRGTIGIIGASGTGIQEVSCQLARRGQGVSQAIGVGGRDLQREIGGMMMLQAIKALESQADTDVIILLSKPPAKEVREKILREVRSGRKTYVINFLGEMYGTQREGNIYYAETLEEAAVLACSVKEGERVPPVSLPEVSSCKVEGRMEMEFERFAAGQRYLRGLYSGGTLASEAVFIIENKERVKVHSNLSKTGGFSLKRGEQSREDTILDLGADEFTLGRPHPMIDYELRKESLLRESEDPEVAVILMDVVLGYGSHPNPARELEEVIRLAKKKAEAAGRYLSIVAEVCGVDGDPQGFQDQVKTLDGMGVLVAPSNSSAVRAAFMISRRWSHSIRK